MTKLRFYCRINTNLSWAFFLWTLVITVGFIYVSWCNNQNFVASQERIIKAHRTMLIMTDSLCRESQLKLLEAHADSALLANAANIIQKDWLSASDTQTREDTRNLLELEFNKIQHEYDVLALWGGILTIVFLIFTFYSLSKSDEINRQSQEIAENIRRIHSKVTSINEEIENTRKKVVANEKGLASKIENAATNAASKALHECNNKLTALSQSVGKLGTKIAEFPATVDNEYQHLTELKDQHLTEVQSALETVRTIHSSITNTVEQIKHSMEQTFNDELEKAITNITGSVKTLENRIKHAEEQFTDYAAQLSGSQEIHIEDDLQDNKDNIETIEP